MWVTIDRPGQTGLKKKELEAALNSEYGKGNWRRVHEFNGRILHKPDIFYVCEMAYVIHSFEHEEEWRQLLSQAGDVYDLRFEETLSGLDYSLQLEYTRFHDICIRNVVYKRGWRFEGDKPVQVRWENDAPTWFAEHFDPGKVYFHRPDLIIQPHLEGWWEKDSVEDFYQSNKILQVRLA